MSGVERTPDLDRTLSAWLDDRAVTRAPDDLLGETLARTARLRPRPAWRIPERWIPMPITLRLAVVPRAVIYLFLLATLIALLTTGGLIVGALRGVSPAPPPDAAINGLIAYSDLGDIRLIDADGEQRRQLTSGPDLDYVGAWSPDGSWLAYWSVAFDGDPHDASARRMAARVGRNLSIRIIRPDGTDARTLASALAWSASGETGIAWAPDGSAIAYDHRGSDGTERIDVAPVDGGPVRTVASDAVTPGWAPDGSAIAYVTNRYAADPDGARGAQFGLMSVPAMGGEPRPMSRARGDDASFFWPQWSNDSQRLLFHAGNIFVARADGSAEDALTTGQLRETLPRWSPTNDRVAFLRERPQGGFALVIADLVGGNEVVLDTVRVGAEPPVWSPDGRSVLVVAEDEDGGSPRLAVLDPTGRAAPRSLPVEGLDGFGWAAWQP